MRSTAAGVTNCSGTPTTCAPLWTTSAPPTSVGLFSSPAVANGVVYVSLSNGSTLYAFDAAGVTNCSGTPTTCAPLWTAATGYGQMFPSTSSPTVAHGVVYVGSRYSTLYAFDAAGVTNCSGTPTKCAPLWTAATGGQVSSPVVANGVVYVGSNASVYDHKVYAFDAAGVTNCSGTPTKCAPLWTAATGGSVGSPAVANGVVYVGSGDTNLYAFDAAGVTNCSGTPTTCAPLWTAATGGTVGSPTVANGVVYVSSSDTNMYAFDAAGVTNCSGDPTTCAPLWTAATGGSVGSSAVANGVVYVSSSDTNMYAFDAAGVANCSGDPTTCAPLWTATAGNFVFSSPAVANGVVYVGSSDIKLHAYSLP